MHSRYRIAAGCVCSNAKALYTVPCASATSLALSLLHVLFPLSCASSSMTGAGEGPFLPTDLSDTELIAGCISGESFAWDALVDRYKRLVYSIPLRSGLSADDSADVFQTVFTSLLRNLRRLRDPQGVAAWLITTAKRESWSLSRKRRREPANYEAVAALASANPGGVATRANEEVWADQAYVQEALNLVGARCHDLLWSLYFDASDPSYEEIGRRLGMPEGSIGPTRARCLEKMRSILQSMGMKRL